MGIIQSMGRGWKLAIASLHIIERNKNLLIFPILSILSILLIIGIVIFYGGLLMGTQRF